MGISFRISKIGKKFRSNTSKSPSHPVEKPSLSDVAPYKILPSTEVVDGQKVGDVAPVSIPSATDVQLISPGEEYEVSFALNLFLDGFYIGKPDETIKHQAPFHDVAKQLLPYNRTSKSLFSAIEAGWLPGDILDDIPCKYYNGAIMCEVRDYRKCLAEEGTHVSVQSLPTVKKIILRMSLENIVNDIPKILDDSWTYSDLLEVESRILKSVQPKLYLDPSTNLYRLHSNSNLNNLNIVARSGQKRKKVRSEEFTVALNNQNPSKKVFNNTIPENSNNESVDLRSISGETTMQYHHLSSITQQASNKPLRVGQEGMIPPIPSSSQSQFQTSVGYPRVIQDRFSLGYSTMKVHAPQNIMNYHDTVTGNKRDNHDMIADKRKHTLVGQDVNQHMGLPGADTRWKNSVLSQQMDTKGVQYSTSAAEVGNSIYRNQQGIKIGIKKEQSETEKLGRQEAENIKNILQMPETEGNSLDRQQWRSQQLNQQSLMKSHFQSHKQWQNNLGSPVDKDARKKQVPSPRISSIPLIQSPISGDISNVTLNGQFGTASSSYGTPKEKTSAFSNAPLGVSSVTSTSDSFQRQPHLKRKASSISKTHSMNGVPSPASIGNSSVPLNVSSPPAPAATSTSNSSMLDRFNAIVGITKRRKLNAKGKKAEIFNKTCQIYSTKEVSIALDDEMSSEDFKSDIYPLSKTLIDGTMNNCKTRILTYGPLSNISQVPSRITQRVVMNEMPKDGTVMISQSDVESNIHSPDCMFTLPNTHYADLFGTQLIKSVKNEGNQIFGDQTTLHTNDTSGNLSSFVTPSSDSVVSEGKQPEGVSGRQSNQALVNITNNDVSQLSSPQILPNSMGMLSPGNSQGYLPNGANMTMSMRPQKMEQTLIQQRQSQQLHQHQMQLQLHHQNQPLQQQQAQLQRSSSILQMNPPIPHLIGQSSSMQLGGNHNVNKQNQLQQLQQQQQAHQFPRKAMMGLGAMSMGNSKMGLGGFSNVIGMRGISSPIAPGIGNIAQNSMNMGSANNFGVNLRPMVPHANTIARLRMVQNRNLYTGQPAMTSLPGNNSPMLQNSMGMPMTDQTLRPVRPNISQMQRNAMTSMGPPKTPGDIYMNPQQLQQMQQLHLQQQQQLTTPSQQSHVSTPSLMVSSPAAAMQQQHIISQSSQQIAMSPQQVNAGTMQQISNNGTSSPQLSSHSQTHGSVGTPPC